MKNDPFEHIWIYFVLNMRDFHCNGSLPESRPVSNLTQYGTKMYYFCIVKLKSSEMFAEMSQLWCLYYEFALPLPILIACASAVHQVPFSSTDSWPCVRKQSWLGMWSEMLKYQLKCLHCEGLVYPLSCGIHYMGLSNITLNPSRCICPTGLTLLETTDRGDWHKTRRLIFHF